MDGNHSIPPGRSKLMNRWVLFALGTVLATGLSWLLSYRSENASGAQNVAASLADGSASRNAHRSIYQPPGQIGKRGPLHLESPSDPSNEDPGPAKGAKDPLRPDGADDSSRQIIGTWKLDDTIKRVVEIRADGTATMQVKLDYFGALLYGPEMTMQLKWDVKEGVLTHHLEKGTPEANVRRLIRDWGNERSYKLVELSDREMVLESTETHDVHHWQRVDTSTTGESSR